MMFCAKESIFASSIATSIGVQNANAMDIQIQVWKWPLRMNSYICLLVFPSPMLEKEVRINLLIWPLKRQSCNAMICTQCMHDWGEWCDYWNMWLRQCDCESKFHFSDFENELLWRKWSCKTSRASESLLIWFLNPDSLIRGDDNVFSTGLPQGDILIWRPHWEGDSRKADQRTEVSWIPGCIT